ncbi:hypothetical protein [Peredibacter starrii]|uniref:Uncharacterized protein n=1 Tax=Peredibacter starrii TaxID=28202 RepID=A0AAX4HP99_9BACT|nr:hypothetical protein [Peredibacter starrii]WPU64932.1 hypothetical protein SOO65_19740 [Peredibacter starrii]
MQEIYFLARHTPFWAVPLIVLGGEFAYLFWLKKKKSSAILCLIFAFVGLMACSFYVWAGGPQKSVKFIKTMHRNHFQ